MLVFKTKNFNNCLVQANGLKQMALSFKQARITKQLCSLTVNAFFNAYSSFCSLINGSLLCFVEAQLTCG